MRARAKTVVNITALWESEIEALAGNLAVSNGTELKLVWALNGVPAALNILHFRHQPGAVMTQATADAIFTLVKAQMTNTGHIVSVSTVVSLLRTEIRHMDALSDPWWIGQGATLPGTGAGHPLPAATAFVVTLKTGLRGRSFNGRVYLWGFDENTNDVAGGITAGARTAAVDFITAIRTGMASSYQLEQVIVSRFTTPPGSPPNTPPTERNPPLMTTVTTAVALDLRWDVQRRRAVPGI